MPISLTAPIVPASVTNYVIISVLVILEPSLAITVNYSAADSSGNPIGGPATTQSVQLNAAAMTSFNSTGGSPKAKLYAALQTQLGITGTVT